MGEAIRQTRSIRRMTARTTSLTSDGRITEMMGADQIGFLNKMVRDMHKPWLLHIHVAA